MAANDNNPQAGQGRALPKKEQDLFRNVVKHYEMKQYKKAIKQSDAILKKYPKHGETLAMKGLTLNCMGKREEAHALVKEGLMNDMRSHVCWHVYGLLHRSDRNYNEAIKAYKHSLRIDPENLQILRDLSLLQIQMRDLAGFAVTRHTLLTLKSNAKINWISFALAKHLTGDLRGAISVIDTYLGTLTEGSPELERGFESSELAMYRNTVIAEIPGNYEEALDHLSECEDLVMDRSSWLMTRARYQLNLGQFEEARKTFLAMFERGTFDDYRVHSGYMCALLELDPKTCEEALSLSGMDTVATIMKLTDAQKQNLLEAYREELLPLMPKSPTVQRIPLTLLDGDEFRAAMDSYCRKSLAKGVPSLCSDLSSFHVVEENGRYRRIDDPVEVKSSPIYHTFVEMADAYIASLETDGKFSTDDEKDSPSTVLWAWFFRAGLHELAGEYEEGILLLDKCLEHTPTAVDVYELKARLLKAAGDINAAVECLDMGRELDKQDRYINNQTTKYMLQAGMLESALEKVALFTRHEGNPEQNLYDMQCSWYELELAAALERNEEWGRSLKKYAAVIKHFEDFHEDQFDFHSYCVRKVTLRAYLDVLRYEDHVWGEEYCRRAAESTIHIYLHLYDNPSITAGEQEPDYSKMTAAQKKKAKAVVRKKKKAAEKKAAEAAEKLKEKEEDAKENGNKAKKSPAEAEKDTDPDGKELMMKDPLEEANKYSAILAAHAFGQLSTWMLRYDVAIRRGKALIAMQALFKARAINAQSSGLFARIVDFASKADGFDADQPAVRDLISGELPVLLNNLSVDKFVASAVEQVKQDPLASLESRIDVAKVLVKTKCASVKDAASIIVDGGLNGKGVTVVSCRDALITLEGFGDDATGAKENWVAAVSERYPLLKGFDG